MSDLSPATHAGDPLPALTVVTGTKPRPAPLDPPMVPFALAGVAAFAVATLITWFTDAPDLWFQTSLAGLLWGIPGTLTMVVHDRNRRRRRALTHPEFTVDG
ncbi:hypothetical protein Aca07nite_46930 [Actinoplanes capillaceus]|uniref:DUF2530 domain-containing protein n=2 Tax=Actinoplanes TaxID=1865 RepID=A0ABQ3WMH2_9ACTN|nr:hypothetical protein Aca07nite_46930 [Actinoplanes capillaceus]